MTENSAAAAALPWEDLVAAAHEAIRRAYAPYSCYPVGAALLGRSGRVYTGCNVENASFPMSLCAERTAVCKAVADGERTYAALVVLSANGGTPCGACRQVLREFCEDLPILVVSAAGERRLFCLSQLLPQAFAPSDLPSSPVSGDAQCGQGCCQG
ncbi:MAG: cytidine deaminase [Chloroflexi bacterium]|nr:cytidine deaminase [Chloroflexota bacterium]